MARSLRKNTFVSNDLLSKIDNLNMNKEKKIIVTWSRRSAIVPAMIGHTIAVHNGRSHLPIFNKWYDKPQIRRICTYFHFPGTCEKG